MSERLLEGKAGVVTGGGGGIGLAVAKLLAAQGASLIVNDYGVNLDGTSPSEGPAHEAAKAINGAGGRAAASVGDVSYWAYAEGLIEGCVREYGRLDFLVTAAGILRDRMMFNMSEEEFDAVVAVHLKGTFACGHFAGAHMRKQGSGSIVTFVSGAQEGNVGQSNYSAAKGGIASMTYTWALELHRYGVRANGVVPVAQTRMIATSSDTSAASSLAAPPGRVAEVVAFLASDAAAGVTGQMIGVNRTGVSIWQHPREKVVAFSKEGWTLAELATEFPRLFEGQYEPYGLRVKQYVPPK